MIAIRTHFSSSTGIGHLARTYRLASALIKFQFESLFFIDHDQDFIENYLHPFKYSLLYPKGDEFQDEESDARLFIKNARQHEIEAVVVDDYRLSMIWEKKAKSLSCPLIVLDDRNLVHHKCSMIVDAKWTGISTSERYNDKIPKKCIRLLGPEYVMLDEPYLHFSKTSNTPKSKNTLSIMLSLGGGGDMTILGKLVEKLLIQASTEIDFLVQPVIGYFASNKEVILSIAKKDRRVKPIIHARSLYDYLKTTTLYIGSAGGTLYEILFMGIPAVTFVLSENHYNSLNHLEDLGHYLHLNDFSEESYDKLVELAWILIININRIQKLYDTSKKVKIDGLGAQRVARSISSLLQNCEGYRSSPSFFPRHDKDTKDSSYDFERLDDQHINRYFDARNYSANLGNMIDTKKIDRLDHYLWWLKTDRISFLLKKKGKPLLYIWHQPKTIEGITVLIGGWFVCSGSCNGLDALHALNQQLEITDKEFPDLPWVEVIRKNNQFVMSLNKRFGFEIMDESHPLFRVAKQCFPLASFENFNYLFR